MNKITNLKGISRSTLYEELKRGTVTQKNSDLTTREEYFAETGQIVYEKNRQNCRRPLKIAEAKEFVGKLGILLNLPTNAIILSK